MGQATEPKPRVFLTAEWRHLVLVNYIVDPLLLEPLVPPGVELDLWQGRAYVSLVGFLFRESRIHGIPIPFHREFEEVNLRFYVRRQVGDEVRRAVTFVKELVPKRAVAWTARLLYGENYAQLPMGHRIESGPQGVHVAYTWQPKRGRANRLEMTTAEPLAPLIPGSEAEFIAEHYWGYTRAPGRTRAAGRTIEYRVEHPPWRACAAQAVTVDCDVEQLYGSAWVPYLEVDPSSAFYAEGSAVSVHHGTALPSPS